MEWAAYGEEQSPVRRAATAGASRPPRLPRASAEPPLELPSCPAAPSSSSSSVPAAAAGPLAPAGLPNEAFPPSLERAEELRHADAELRRATLEAWRRALTEALEGVARGSGQDAPPLEEVWHWLVASDRLARCAAFCGHPAVAAAAAALEADAEGAEVARRWAAAVRDLRKAQRESASNASYLRVVEAPMRRLDDPALLLPGVTAGEGATSAAPLAGAVRALLRSLQKIYCTAPYYKEERMAQLLRRVLKLLVARAANHLPGLYEVARPPGGLGAAFRTASQLRDGFQAYIDNHFIAEPAAGASSPAERRPATSTVASARGERPSGGSVPLSARRAGAGELGWWRAMTRTSLEHAAHCRLVCARQAQLLEKWACLGEVVPHLRAADPALLRDVEAFAELHSAGLKAGGSAAELLDLKRQVESRAAIQEVEDRLAALAARAQRAGAPVPEPPLERWPEAEVWASGMAVVASNGGMAEVLTLPEGLADACGGSRPSTAKKVVEEEIQSLQEDLDKFGSQLDSCLDLLLSRKAARTFAPPPRSNGHRAPPPSAASSPSLPADPSSGRLAAAAASSSSAVAPAPAAASDEEDAAEKAAALEVAKRASWYKEPPPLLPVGVQLIQVRHSIVQRRIHRVPSRPRTSHPVLVVTRPAESRRPATAAPAVGRHRYMDSDPSDEEGGEGEVEVDGRQEEEEEEVAPGAAAGVSDLEQEEEALLEQASNPAEEAEEEEDQREADEEDHVSHRVALGSSDEGGEDGDPLSFSGGSAVAWRVT